MSARPFRFRRGTAYVVKTAIKMSAIVFVKQELVNSGNIIFRLLILSSINKLSDNYYYSIIIIIQKLSV